MIMNEWIIGLNFCILSVNLLVKIPFVSSYKKPILSHMLAVNVFIMAFA